MAEGDRWQALDHHCVKWKQWGEAYFIYHPASGQTHFLNELAAFIVRTLGPGAKSMPAIYAETLAAYELEDLPDLRDAVAGILVNLDHLGLIERAAIR